MLFPRACIIVLLSAAAWSPAQPVQISAQNPASSEDLLDQAHRALQANRQAEALGLLTRAMERFEATLSADPHDSAARDGEHKAAITLALQLRVNDGPAALAVLERARDVLPDDSVILTDLGIQADVLHRYPESTDALRAALRLRPDDPTAQYALAHTLTDSGNATEAESLFHAYLAQRPNDASAHYGLGHLLQMQQRNDEATAEFQRSIALQPVQTESYYQLGQMALAEHRDDDARAMFQKTLSRMSTHGGALAGMGILAYRGKNFSSARDWLRQAIAASPDYEPAHYYLGLTLARLGDKEGSTRELANAAQLAAAQQGKGAPIGVITSPPEPR